MIVQSAQDIKEIVSYGGGVKVDAKNISVQDLKEIAGFAKSGGALVFIANANELGAQNMKEIGSFGGGQVIFE